MRPDTLAHIQSALDAEGLDGWLFYDFRGSDPIAYRILELPQTLVTTRRWYYLIPRHGSPLALVSAVEPHTLDDLPGQRLVYRTAAEHTDQLHRLLAGRRRIAMQYSPENALPYVSRVDAGTVELARACGPEVVSAADLVQQFEAVWTPAQLASHRRAAEVLRRTVDLVFSNLAAAVAAGRPLSEMEAQRQMLDHFRRCGLTTDKPPIVAVDAHSADPHYAPNVEENAPIPAGSFVLIDLWAKEAGGVYADITWTGQLAHEVRAEVEEVFQIVRRARDTALEAVRQAARRRQPIRGFDVDAAARDVIAAAGYGEQFVHRTGHSIGTEVHGNGANIDGYETRDARRLLPRTCFSIEPGIYLPGRFGVRSEIDVYLSEDDALISGEPVQTAVVPILSRVSA